MKEQQRQQPGLRLVGYYQCNERAGDAELGAGRRIADRLEAAAPDSVAAVVSRGGSHWLLWQVAFDDCSACPGRLIVPMCRACLQLDSAALQAALEQQQQDLQLQPMLQLFVKDGARSWVKVPLSGEGGSGKGGGFRCPSSQGIAAQLAQVSLLSWPASFCLHPLGCVEPNTFGCCTTCLPARPLCPPCCRSMLARGATWHCATLRSTWMTSPWTGSTQACCRAQPDEPGHVVVCRYERAPLAIPAIVTVLAGSLLCECDWKNV